MKKSCPTHLYTVGYDETKTLSRTFSKNFVVDDFVPDEQHTPPAWPEKASIRAIPHELASKQTHPKETMRRILRRKVVSQYMQHHSIALVCCGFHKDHVTSVD